MSMQLSNLIRNSLIVLQQSLPNHPNMLDGIRYLFRRSAVVIKKFEIKSETCPTMARPLKKVRERG